MQREGERSDKSIVQSHTRPLHSSSSTRAGGCLICLIFMHCGTPLPPLHVPGRCKAAPAPAAQRPRPRQPRPLCTYLAVAKQLQHWPPRCPGLISPAAAAAPTAVCSERRR